MLTAADTAFAIAHVRAMEAELPEPERLFSDPFAALFRDAGAHAKEGTERFLALPLLIEGVRVRTRFLDDLVREALREGIRQIVLLGAGFDARGHRMPEIPEAGARVYEVDFDAQLANKRAILAAAKVTVPPWIEHVPCDFNEPAFDEALEASLAEHGFRAGVGAVFTWEGVTPYIGTEAVDRTLRFMARVGGPGSRVGFDYAPIAWDEPAAERAARAGFRRFDEHTLASLWQGHLPGDPHPNATVLCMGVAQV